jgi:hypothetical protein
VVFIVVTTWLLRYEFEFEPSFIITVAPIISTFLTLTTLFYPSEKLSAFASFVFGTWRGEFRQQDFDILLRNN